jgi:hypothetical protein
MLSNLNNLNTWVKLEGIGELDCSSELVSSSKESSVPDIHPPFLNGIHGAFMMLIVNTWADFELCFIHALLVAMTSSLSRRVLRNFAMATQTRERFYEKIVVLCYLPQLHSWEDKNVPLSSLTLPMNLDEEWSAHRKHWLVGWEIK